MWNLKYGTNELIYETDKEIKLVVAKWGHWGRDRLGACD